MTSYLVLILAVIEVVVALVERFLRHQSGRIWPREFAGNNPYMAKINAQYLNIPSVLHTLPCTRDVFWREWVGLSLSHSNRAIGTCAISTWNLTIVSTVASQVLCSVLRIRWFTYFVDPGSLSNIQICSNASLACIHHIYDARMASYEVITPSGEQIVHPRYCCCLSRTNMFNGAIWRFKGASIPLISSIPVPLVSSLSPKICTPQIPYHCWPSLTKLS